MWRTTTVHSEHGCGRRPSKRSHSHGTTACRYKCTPCADRGHQIKGKIDLGGTRRGEKRICTRVATARRGSTAALSSCVWPRGFSLRDVPPTLECSRTLCVYRVVAAAGPRWAGMELSPGCLADRSKIAVATLNCARRGTPWSASAWRTNRKPGRFHIVARPRDPPVRVHRREQRTLQRQSRTRLRDEMESFPPGSGPVSRCSCRQGASGICSGGSR